MLYKARRNLRSGEILERPEKPGGFYWGWLQGGLRSPQNKKIEKNSLYKGPPIGFFSHRAISFFRRAFSAFAGDLSFAVTYQYIILQYILLLN